MADTAQDYAQDAEPAAKLPADINPSREDSYWQGVYARERYYRPGLDYEDYAPAYCVGYIGYAQYGGSFDDAEKSLCANWERIKGDSRLTLDIALVAMRAAWDRMASRNEREAARKAFAGALLRRRVNMPSFKLTAVPLH